MLYEDVPHSDEEFERAFETLSIRGKGETVRLNESIFRALLYKLFNALQSTV